MNKRRKCLRKETVNSHSSSIYSFFIYRTSLFFLLFSLPLHTSINFLFSRFSFSISLLMLLILFLFLFLSFDIFSSFCYLATQWFTLTKQINSNRWCFFSIRMRKFSLLFLSVFRSSSIWNETVQHRFYVIKFQLNEKTNKQKRKIFTMSFSQIVIGSYL